MGWALLWDRARLGGPAGDQEVRARALPRGVAPSPGGAPDDAAAAVWCRRFRAVRKRQRELSVSAYIALCYRIDLLVTPGNLILHAACDLIRHSVKSKRINRGLEVTRRGDQHPLDDGYRSSTSTWTCTIEFYGGVAVSIYLYKQSNG